jgi:hypothetical protein
MRKSIKMVLTVATVMVMLAGFATPAMIEGGNFDKVLNRMLSPIIMSNAYR